MDECENNVYKARRVRCNPMKRWTVPEERLLVKYLLKSTDFERPTSREFYQRFIDEYNIRSDWKQVRSKIRNMRAVFKKAKVWQFSTEADAMDAKNVENALLKKFLYFYEFEQIFANLIDEPPTFNRSVVKEESETEEFTTVWSEDDCEKHMQNEKEEPLFIDEPVSEEEQELDDPVSLEDLENDEELAESYQSLDEIESLPDTEFLPNTSREVRQTSSISFNDIMQVQSVMITLKKRKLYEDLTARQREIVIREKELVLKEKELLLMQKQLISQERLKEKEIQSRENLRREEIQNQKKMKILELEMKERLGMEELRLKYKK